MSNLAQAISQDFAEYFRMVREQAHRWVDPLTDEQMWRQPFEHGVNHAFPFLAHFSRPPAVAALSSAGRS